MARLVFCRSRMACSSCHASTRLMATASTSSRIPSLSRKLSKVEPLWSIFLRFFLAFMGVFVGGGELELFTHPRSVPCTVHSSKRERDAIRRARCGLLWDLGRLEPLALQGFPLHVSAQVFPESPQPPDHVQLPVRKMFEEAIADKTDYVLPVVIPLVGNFFLQDGADGDHRRKRIPEYEELQEKFPAQHTQTSCKNDCYDPHDLDDRREQFKQPQIGESKATNPAVTRPEEHIPVRPEHVQ